MRKTLLVSATLFGMALTLPALAQDNTAQPNGGLTRADTMPARHHGRHRAASNLVPSDTHSQLAHALPSNHLGPDASSAQYLQAAQDDLRHHRGGAAQEGMERAETRLLDRSVPLGQGNVPDQAPAIHEITQALAALGHHDWQMAEQHLNAAIQHARMAENESGGATAPARQMAENTSAAGVAAAHPVTAHAGTSAPMTIGNPPMPFQNTLPPNGGVVAPNGGIMSPAPSH